VPSLLHTKSQERPFCLFDNRYYRRNLAPAQPWEGSNECTVT